MYSGAVINVPEFVTENLSPNVENPGSQPLHVLHLCGVLLLSSMQQMTSIPREVKRLNKPELKQVRKGVRWNEFFGVAMYRYGMGPTWMPRTAITCSGG